MNFELVFRHSDRGALDTPDSPCICINRGALGTPAIRVSTAGNLFARKSCLKAF